MLAVLAALGAQARTLTPDEALSRLQTDPAAAKASAARGIAAAQPHLAFTQTTETGQPAVYVFDNQASNQVLFVSADDVVAPLLGYADSTPAGTEMPPQLRWWLEQPTVAPCAFCLIIPKAPNQSRLGGDCGNITQYIFYARLKIRRMPKSCAFRVFRQR